MYNKKTISLLTSGAVLVAALAAPFVGASAALAQNRQNDKNNMRNIGIAAGAGAGYELLKGHGTKALILGAGAAYAGKKYEDQRKAENKDSKSAARRRYLAAHRHHYTHHTYHHG